MWNNSKKTHDKFLLKNEELGAIKDIGVISLNSHEAWKIKINKAYKKSILFIGLKSIRFVSIIQKVQDKLNKLWKN